MAKAKRTAKKLTSSIVAIVVLGICLCVTTMALLYSTVAVESNLFETGTVELNLNDGRPVIEEGEYLFEPGMTVEKAFFLENRSSCDVYYRLYLDEVEGGLAEVLDITIREGETELYSGKASELSKAQVGAADDTLKLGERKDLTIVFHYPEEAGNETEEQYLSFELKAEAVQSRNNPEKQFE